MKILLTGAFGNLGTSCIKELAKQGHEIRCFDIKSKMTEIRFEKYRNTPKMEVVWGDILDKNSIRNALEGIEGIIHTAAIIPPPSEQNPELAKKVNVTGTKNLIEEAEAFSDINHFVFASSVSVHGPQKPSNPLLKVTDPLKPTDNYTHHKVECEEYIYNCKLNWTIIRFGAILAVETAGQPRGGLDDVALEFLFGIPLEQKVEAIHSYDAARAMVNALGNDRAVKSIFFGGGGKECQLYQKEFIFPFLEDMGIGGMPDDVFKQAQSDSDWYYTHWMDTTESQEVLQYQNITYDQYLRDKKKPNILNRFLMFFIGPFIKRSLIKKSPYKR
ncbi:MAG: NAD-dependent epimerase/dehydratase family protein [Candidatus Heimdallarchaeota archaeon]